MDWIRWTRYEGTQEADFGQMPYNKAVETLKQFGEQAKKTLDETGADHIVYGLVEYDKNGRPIEIGFYNLAFTDADFQQRVVGLNNSTVYAVHSRR